MSDLYRTSHRYLASYLVAHGYPVIEWKSDQNYVTFGFEVDGPDQLRLVQGFYGNTIAVLPQDFIRGLETVRMIIRGVQDQGAEQKEGTDV